MSVDIHTFVHLSFVIYLYIYIFIHFQVYISYYYYCYFLITIIKILLIIIITTIRRSSSSSSSSSSRRSSRRRRQEECFRSWPSWRIRLRGSPARQQRPWPKRCKAWHPGNKERFRVLRGPN